MAETLKGKIKAGDTVQIHQRTRDYAAPRRRRHAEPPPHGPVPQGPSGLDRVSPQPRRAVTQDAVAKALERQERERGRELDDLLATLDVELIPWQRDVLGRWIERKLMFRVR